MNDIFSPEQLFRLRAGLDGALWHSHRGVGRSRTWDGRSNKPREELFVAALVLDGLQDLQLSWELLMREFGLQLSLTGVFCHATPQAEYRFMGRIASPELADLLIVRRHVNIDQSVRQVAVLIQAKMSDDGEIKLIDRDKQLYLYENWPEFEVRAANHSGLPYSVGVNRHQCKYAAILKNSPRPGDNFGSAGFCPWSVKTASKNGFCSVSLSDFILALLQFKAGRQFFEISHSGCDWTRLVHFLLDETFRLPSQTCGKRLSDKRGNTINMNRLAFIANPTGLRSGIGPKFTDGGVFSGGGGDDNEDTRSNFAEGGFGRLLLIETVESENNE